MTCGADQRSANNTQNWVIRVGASVCTCAGVDVRCPGAGAPLTLGGALYYCTCTRSSYHMSYHSGHSSNLYESESTAPIGHRKRAREREISHARAHASFLNPRPQLFYQHPNPEPPWMRSGSVRVCGVACQPWQRGPWSFGRSAHRTAYCITVYRICTKIIVY